MTIAIHRGGAIILALNGADRYEHARKVMGENVLNLSFTYFQEVAFQIGDYITYNGSNYSLNQLPKLDKLSSNQFKYTCIFEGVEYELRKAPFMLFGEGEFDLIGNAHTFVDLIITNLNDWFGSGWSKGNVIANTDYKTLSFNGENCLEALNRIVKEFETEFYFVNKQLNFNAFGVDNGLTFRYGQNNALYSISRDNVSSKDIITRLYAFGGSKNLPVGYRTNKKRLVFETGYIEQNVATYGKIGASKTFDDIYPHRTGAISAVDAADVLKFSDSGMDFDLNSYLLPATRPKIAFKTGDLAGYEFEIVENGYNATTKTFTLVKLQDGTLSLPNSTLKPKVGDKYTIIDIAMPQSYITAAENELLTKATAYLTQNSSPRTSYAVKCNPLYFSQNNISLNYGDYVTIADEQLVLNRLIRIIGYTLDLIHGSLYNLSLADTIELSISTRVYAQTLETQRVFAKTGIADPNRIRKTRKTTAELLNMVFDADNYFKDGNIRPNSIETNMLAVGSKSGDFVLNGILVEPNYTADKAKVNVSSGTLVHFSIETTVKIWNITGATTTGLVDANAYYIYARCSRSTTAATIVFDTTQRKVDSDATYYYFIMGVLHSVDNGVRGISLSFGQTAINGRFIKTGRVSSPDGQNYFDIDTGNIVGKITFQSGKTDTQIETSISTAQTSANSAATAASTAQTTANNAVSAAATAQSAADGANSVLADIASDNKFTAVEKQSVRSEWNIIAAEKTVNDVQATTFGITTEKTTYGTKFQALATYLNNGTTWSSGIPTWIADANLATTTTIVGATFRTNFKEYYDARTALLNAIAAKAKTLADTAQTSANSAQSTANTKKRHFVAQPTTPYEIGDLWTDGTNIRRCKTARASGSYTASDWEIPVVYDNTQTIIDGGIVTSGTVQVADTATVKAGITGAAKLVGSLLASAVRLWAGEIFANRETAAWKVLENGKMYARGCELLVENSHYGIKLDPDNNKISILGAGGVIGEILGGLAGESLSGTYDYNFAKLVLYWRDASGAVQKTMTLSPLGLKIDENYIIDSDGNISVPGTSLLTGRTTISSPFIMPKMPNGNFPSSPVEGLSFYQDYQAGKRLYTYIGGGWRYIQYT